MANNDHIKIAEEHPNFQLINEKEAAKILNRPVSYMQQSRFRGDGPPFYRIGRFVRYDMAELIEWIKARRYHSTSETPEIQ